MNPSIFSFTSLRFWGILLLFALTALSACKKETIAPNDDADCLDFEATTIDYGTIQKGSDPLKVFKFKNNGSEPLIIKNAKGSCGCLVPTYPKEPILPQGTGEIEVRYDTQRVGVFTKTVTILTNCVVDTQTLTVKGNVVE